MVYHSFNIKIFSYGLKNGPKTETELFPAVKIIYQYISGSARRRFRYVSGPFAPIDPRSVFHNFSPDPWSVAYFHCHFRRPDRRSVGGFPGRFFNDPPAVFHASFFGVHGPPGGEKLELIAAAENSRVRSSKKTAP